MAQALKDLTLKLKSDRKTQVIAVVLVACVAFVMMNDGGAPRRRAAPKPAVQVGTNDPDERWKDLVERFNKQLNDLTHTTNALQEEVGNQKKAMQQYEATTAEIFKKILERLAEVQSQPASTSSAPTGPVTVNDLGDGDIPDVDPGDLQNFGGDQQIIAQPPEPPKQPRLAALMPGDSVRIKMLAGVNAPTDGTPYPVVLKLIGDVTGPDGNSIPLGEARLIAAAQGSLTDSRVLLRLTRLSIRLPNGRRKEFAVDGWVVGEDGIRGMEGVLIDPIGKAIAGAGMAGGLAGLGQGIAMASRDTLTYSSGAQNSTIDASKLPQYAGGIAVASAATEWQQIIKDRLSQMVPVVQVLSGREATAVFSQSLAIPDLLEQVDEDPSVVFASLD
jgi:hypothetical protein